MRIRARRERGLAPKDLAVEWLGTLPYAEALEVQAKRLEARRAGAAGDVLLLLEHPPVVTLGRRGRRENIRLGPAELAARGIGVHEVARGGDVTYHAPGQLVGYPIVDLAARGKPDVVAFLREIEAALVAALGGLGVRAEVRPGYTGVFVAGAGRRGERPRKIASIGVGVRGWVTCHGFALNVTLDPRAFDVIVPCGLHEVSMTSLARELGLAAPADLDLRAREAVAQAFRDRLGSGGGSA